MNFRFAKITVCLSLALKDAASKCHARAKGAYWQIRSAVIRSFVGYQLAFVNLCQRRRGQGRINTRLGSSKVLRVVQGLQTSRVRLIARVVDRCISVVAMFGLRYGRERVFEQAKNSVLRIASDVRHVLRQADRIILCVQDANSKVNNRCRGHVYVSIQVRISEWF